VVNNLTINNRSGLHRRSGLMKYIFLILFVFLPAFIVAQDTSLVVDKKVITLKEVVVRNNLDVPSFIDRVKKDTTFHKAFKNLRVLGFTALNDIRMMDKKNRVKASLQSKTKQVTDNGCRQTVVLEEKAAGDIYDKNKHWNYYTAEMYASLMFAKERICGEDNIVKGNDISTRGKSGLANAVL
jgi:hypothetical protein